MRTHALLVFLTPLLPFAFGWDPTWESLDSRPLPKWYDDSKFGIFIHWGVFSVPSWGNFSGEWFWQQWQGSQAPAYDEFVRSTEKPGFAYADYARRFRAELYDPNEWSDLFARSGAQYVVLTGKHHEGYCLWDSKAATPLTWNWNAMDVGPRRDLVGDLSSAIKKTKSVTTGKALRWGIYHSLYEWFNPLFLADQANGFNTSLFRDQKTMPELYDLVNQYEPELIWSDGHEVAPDSYWRATEFLAWYATNSSVAKTAVWNDRWGAGIDCNHGAYYTCMDRYQPGKLVEKKWENALTIDPGSWGFRRNVNGLGYLSTEHIIHQLVETVAFGGNMLLNIGPAADGTIPAVFWDRLLGIGDWLGINGPAIYSTTTWKVAQNQTDEVYYTFKESAKNTVFAIVTRWPEDDVLVLQAPGPLALQDRTHVTLMGMEQELGRLPWKLTDNGLAISIPPLSPAKIPCQHAWAFAIGGLSRSVKDGNSANGIRGTPIVPSDK